MPSSKPNRERPLSHHTISTAMLAASVAGLLATESLAAEQVGVRAGAHATFERIVFEWSDEIGYRIARQGDEIVVEFDRPGRFDFSPVPEELGPLVVGARTEGGDVGRRVLVSIRPDAEFRWFDLDDNLVALDVLESMPIPVARPEGDVADVAPPVIETTVDPVAQDTKPRAVSKRRTISKPQAVSEPPEVSKTEAPSSEVASPDLTAGLSPKGAPMPLVRAAPEPQPVPEGVAALRQELRTFSQLIGQLAERMDRLEQRMALGTTGLDSIIAGGPGSTTAIEEALREPPEEAAAPEPQVAQQEQGADSQPAAPGQFDVDETAVDRALERTLVQAGALLLPFGQYEVTPHFGYTRREEDAPILFIDGQPSFVAEGKVRRNEFDAGQSLRIGLPFDSQVEFDLPYRYVDQSTVTSVNGFRNEDEGSGSGMGDISVGVAKTLVREGAWWPDLIGRFRWSSASGETEDSDILLGGGFNEFRGGVSMVKRQDPLAFVGAVSYEKTLENDNIEPGDEVGLSFGAVLAASPETSLRLGLDQRFVGKTEINGETVDGSDDVVGTLTLGASSFLGAGVMLDAAFDIGLTDDAPDYAARIALPVRFNVPTGLF